MRVTIGPMAGSPGVWAVFTEDDSAADGDHHRVLSTHATRDGAATSANQIIRAEAEIRRIKQPESWVGAEFGLPEEP